MSFFTEDIHAHHTPLSNRRRHPQFHSSTGAQRDNVAFKADKVGPRLYQSTLGPDDAPGECGILPSGSVSTVNAASAGNIFTFHITE